MQNCGSHFWAASLAPTGCQPSRQRPQQSNLIRSPSLGGLIPLPRSSAEICMISASQEAWLCARIPIPRAVGSQLYEWVKGRHQWSPRQNRHTPLVSSQRLQNGVRCPRHHLSDGTRSAATHIRPGWPSQNLPVRKPQSSQGRDISSGFSAQASASTCPAISLAAGHNPKVFPEARAKEGDLRA